MYRPGDPRQIAVSDLSKAIPCLVALKFEHSTLGVRAKQHNHSAIATIKLEKYKKRLKLFEYFLIMCRHIQDNHANFKTPINI